MRAIRSTNGGVAFDLGMTGAGRRRRTRQRTFSGRWPQQHGRDLFAKPSGSLMEEKPGDGSRIRRGAHTRVYRPPARSMNEPVV